MDIRVIALLALEGCFALALLYFFGAVQKPRALGRCFLLIFLALAVRLCFFNDTNTDYTWFLKVWVDYYRENGFAGLSRSYGNYNIPYLYFLALFARSELYDLYLIKLLSCFFDIVLAFAAMLLVQKCSQSPLRGIVCFFLVLFWPTVILNSAKWGQCDSIYVSFALLGLAAALPAPDGMPARLSDRFRPLVSMICIAVSFGFKLQAVFLMPLWLVLWVWRKYHWGWFAAFPLTYLLLVLPAVLLGRPLWDAVTLYLDQAGTVGDALNYNSPSLTALLPSVSDPAAVSRALIFFAFAAMLLLLLLGILFRRSLTPRRFLLLAVLMAIVIPFLLPHMHDRYFYAADVLTLCLAVCLPAAAASAVLTEFGSLVCYIAYFPGRYYKLGSIYLTNGRGAVAMLCSLVLAGAAFALELRKDPGGRLT